MINTRMKAFATLTTLVLAVGGVWIWRISAQDSGQNVDDAAISWTRIVFAGDLASNGGCSDHGLRDECDIFEAFVDLSSGQVRDVRQMTDTPESEFAPTWNPNGEIAYFSIFRTPRMKDIGYVGGDAGATGVLVPGAAWPAVSPDGTTLLYVDDATDTIMYMPLDADGYKGGSASALTGVAHQQDPDFSADGRYVVFHETGTGEGVGAVYDREAKSTTSFGFRSGHCAFGAQGLQIACDNVSAGGLLGWMYNAGTVGERELFLADEKPKTLSTFDESLTDCVGTSFNYPTFCGDDAHVLVSTSCNVGGRVAFSRLFLIDLSGSTPVYIPLGETLADTFAGAGMSTWTADCL